MDSSFTEHVLERARERQRKMLNDAGMSESVSQPNLSDIPEENIKLKKEATSDPTLNPYSSPGGSPGGRKMTKQNSRTTITSTIPGSPLTEYKTLNIQNNTINMEIKFHSADNVRLEVEIDAQSDSEDSVNSSPDNAKVISSSADNVNSKPALRDTAKNRLQRLGKLYAGDEDLSSPIHRTEGRFMIEDDDGRLPKQNAEKTSKLRKGLGGLAELANDINQWEDEIVKKKDSEKKCNTPKKSWKPPAPQPPQVSTINAPKPRNKLPAPKPPSSPLKENVRSPQKQMTDPGKPIKLDNDVINTLDKEVKENIVEAVPEEPTKTKILAKKFVPLDIPSEDQKVTPRPPKSVVAKRAAIFESKIPTNAVKKDKDPALLSVSQRKALFENNKGEALLPKAPFGMSIPAKINAKPQIATSVSTPDGLSDAKFDKPNRVNESGNIAAKIAQLNKKKGTISQEQIENKVKEERQMEMDMLLNRYHQKKQIEEVDSESEDDADASETTAMISSKAPKIVESLSHTKVFGTPPPPPLPPSENRRSGEKRTKKSDSPQVQAVLGDIKRIKVTQPKDGNLYPCLSDIEVATETESGPTTTPSPNNSLLQDSFCTSDEGANTSFGREIMEAVCQNRSPQKIVSEHTDSDVTDVFEDMDDYLNECYEDTDSPGPTPPKHCRIISPKQKIDATPSKSFNYKSFSPQKTQQSPKRFQSPCKIITSPKRDSEHMPTHVIDGDEVVPLTHTVSFYRKQQSQPSTTPVRQISRHPQVEEEEDDDSVKVEEKISVTAKIEQLKQEVSKQQMVISQTSRALNLCNSTAEFCGSTEQVEAEKVLLLATHRRQAATQEIQRLEVEGTLRPIGSYSNNLPLEKGTITISNIVLPLKKEYVRALAAAGGKGHHVVCLVKSGEQVVITQLASTVASSPKNPDLELNIPGQVRLDNIFSDFTVTFEVYCLRAQEEFLPHDVKYHITKKGSSKITPKKSKHDSRLVRPPKESPGGPQVVRSSTFALNGYVVFSIQAINKTSWTLNKMPPVSPLEGTVVMTTKCDLDISVELRGFLNMFEDVSGLGAWHRRWCLLKGNTISYWKYPDDERKKAPIDTIDLKSCVSKNITSVSRDICARPNTFLFERERPAQRNDKETLTVVCLSDKTIIKHLLSADTKEERVEWCHNLNKSLAAFRMWGRA